MAVLQLPSATDTEAFRFETELEGVIFKFAFQWNERDSHWYMTLADSEGAAIVSGIKVVARTPLLRGISDARRPPGDIMAYDTTGAGDPGLEDLGENVLLLYHEA